MWEYIRKHGCVELEKRKDGFTVDELDRLSESTTEYCYSYPARSEEYRTLFWKLLKEKSEAFNHEIYGVIWQAREEVAGKVAQLRRCS